MKEKSTTSQSEDAKKPIFCVRPLRLVGEGVNWNWSDVPVDQATHYGIGVDPNCGLPDELITALPAFDQAERAVAQLNRTADALLAARKS